MTVRNYDEKREYPRMTIKAGITYSIDGDSAVYTGLSNNLSHSGIQFTTEKSLSPGNAIAFTLASFDGKVEPLEAKVQVLRVEPLENKFVVAGKITEYK